MKDLYLKDAGELISFISKSPSRFHAVEQAGMILEAAGYEELNIQKKWVLERGGKYFTKKNDSSLAAFIVGNGDLSEEGFRIIGSHTDSPSIRIKPNPQMKVEKNYLKLNTEIYGGPILYSWFDRPLGFAGRVTFSCDKGKRLLSKPVVLTDKTCIIPSIAIHMNRDVNTSFKVDKQKDMLPLLCTVEEIVKDFDLKALLAQSAGVEKDDIMDYELYLYDIAEGKVLGMDNDMISCSQLDDLAMVQASLNTIVDSLATGPVKLIVFFDNEEIGSKTMQGADSPLLASILERISLSLGQDREGYLRALENSFVISSDMAHALHPNAKEKHDPTNHPMLNAGPVIKISSNFRYTSDSESAAFFEMLCRKAQVPVQRFVNNSNERGGSTIAPITAGKLGIKSVDIGNPMLSMHSIKELCGVKDHHYLIKVFKEFFGQ